MGGDVFSTIKAVHQTANTLKYFFATITDRGGQAFSILKMVSLQQGSVQFLFNSTLIDRISCQSASPSFPPAEVLICL